MMDQYRVVLYDPNIPRPERPVQAFFNRIDGPSGAEDWARKYLTSAGPGSEVWVYKLEETLQGSWKKIGSDISLPPNKNSGDSNTRKDLRFKRSPRERRPRKKP